MLSISEGIYFVWSLPFLSNFYSTYFPNMVSEFSTILLDPYPYLPLTIKEKSKSKIENPAP